MKKDMVLILDLGGTPAQSLARRVRACGVYCEILPGSAAVGEISSRGARGLLLAGDGSAPLSDAAWQAELPVLALGQAAGEMVRRMGGRVLSPMLEDQVVTLNLEPSPLFARLNGMGRHIHQLNALQLPEGFEPIARVEGIPAAFASEEKRIYGLQFDIESNDPEGFAILDAFLADICGCEEWWCMEAFAEHATEYIRERVGDKSALMAISGGVDSAVCAVLMHKAIGQQLHCIYVDTGLMRKGDTERVRRVFQDEMGIRLTIVDARERFLTRLLGLSDPAEKWRVVSEEFAAIYEEEAMKLASLDFLVQGTIYTDVIGSSDEDGVISPVAHTALIEPVRTLFKDEVRALGEVLGLPPEITRSQSFPGAGLAIRIVGEVTLEKLDLLREADAIWREEIAQAGLDKRIRRYFTVLSETASTGEKGCRHIISLRALGAAGAAHVAYRMPYDLLERVTERILAALPDIDRVVYDMTTTPPRPTEWE